MPAFTNPSQAVQPQDQAATSLLVPAMDTWPRFNPPLRLGVMASGQGTNLEALATACNNGPLEARIARLVVNVAGCGAQARADRLGIPWVLHDHRQFSCRQDLDRALVSTFQADAVEAVVMAGWMRIVTDVLIDAFPQRLINLHPSLLPSFRGLDAVGQALRAGVSISGCSAHLVCRDVDAGPLLAQAAVPVWSDDDADRLAARIRVQEHRLLPWAVALAAQRWRDPCPDDQG
jgi:phosphoribosylglycinamide formyltransferase-1